MSEGSAASFRCHTGTHGSIDAGVPFESEGRPRGGARETRVTGADDPSSMVPGTSSIISGRSPRSDWERGAGGWPIGQTQWALRSILEPLRIAQTTRGLAQGLRVMHEEDSATQLEDISLSQ